MQRALGIDMTTPRSKSQQHIHSPSHQAKPIVPSQQTPIQQPPPQAKPATTQQQLPQQQPPTQPYSQAQPYSHQYPPSQQQTYHPPQQTQIHASPGMQRHPQPQTGPLQQGFKSDPYSQRGPAAQAGPNQPRIPHPGAVPLPGLAKAPSQPDLGRDSPIHQPVPRQQDRTRSAGSSPAHKPQSQPPPAQDGLTKLFGFGASLLNQASTLINVDPLPTQSTQPSPAKGKVVFSNAGPESRQQQQQGPKQFGMGGPPVKSQIGEPHGQMGAPQSHVGSPGMQMGGPQMQMGGPAMQIAGPQMPMSGPQKQMGGAGQFGGPQMGAQSQKQPSPYHQGMSQQQQPLATQQKMPPHQQQTPSHMDKGPMKQPESLQQPHKPVTAAPVEAVAPPPEPEKPKVNCPLCKTELNISSSDPPNYNTCTQCHSQVCNLCGFNPTPHLVEVRRDRISSWDGVRKCVIDNGWENVKFKTR